MDEELTLRALDKSNVRSHVVVARDGQEALDFLFAQGAFLDRDPNQTPQVVLLDLNLPKINGIEVLRRIRANPNTKHLPVVILTSSNEQSDLVGSYDAGCNSYVRKPVDYEEFVAAAAQMGLYWLSLNQTPA